jgi:acetate kinase
VRVLVVNAGSSSIKLRVLGDEDELLGERDLDSPRSQVDRDALAGALRELPDADVAGHRVVHGGQRFREAVRVDDEILRALHELTDLAPLHQPKSLAGLEAVSEVLPGVPAVACFDTAFHATLHAPAATYALPAALRERYGIRRYGFHGLSHAYASRRATELTGARRIVTCHLGAGASLAAVLAVHSIDTTMGFTPLEGLVMATRSGSVDPGLILWLLEHAQISERDMATMLEHESGLLGLAGTSDMRELLVRTDHDAELALAVYVHRLRAGIAAMTASLRGLDALVFTGGVGENSAEVRGRAAEGLDFLGIQLDEERNIHTHGDTDLTADGARVRTLVIAAREDLEIARQVRQLLRRRLGP